MSLLQLRKSSFEAKAPGIAELSVATPATVETASSTAAMEATSTADTTAATDMRSGADGQERWGYAESRQAER